MTEEIVHKWQLDSGILTKLTGSSCPLLAANSSFGPNHNPTMFMLKLYYNSLSLELDNFTTPVKIKSFTVKISGESTYTSNSRYATFPGSVRQLFPGTF